MRIAIAGASGNLGRRTADDILEKIDPTDLVLVTREPSRLAAYAARGVAVRFGDYDQPESLAPAVAGVERLLLISTTEIGRRVAQHVAAIVAAKATGVGHIVYTSITNPSPSNPVVVAAEHRSTEEAIRASGMAWTFLRNSIYAEIQVGSLLPALTSGQLVHNQGTGSCAFVARDDCAAVAAAVLATDGHEFETYDVTGPELLTADRTVAITSEVAGASVAAVAVDDEAYASGLVEYAALPEQLASSLATFGRAIREGHQAQLSNVVELLTGRPATPFATVVRANLPVAV